ncbi:MAG: endonuclease Q family protein [Promethearchaeota archaeon]
MQKVCDLHIHSKFSGGASKNINLYNLASNCMKKGLDIIGTGDCLHLLWLKELKRELIEHSDGLFYIEKVPSVNFLLQTEIEAIWRNSSSLKKAHFILTFPNFEKLENAIEYLSKFGNLNLEGRPQVYLSAERLIFDLKEIDNYIEIIPAHIFTPFFGILGAKLDFKSMKEALKNAQHYVSAIETGLSADPLMVRRISELNRFSIISNSDSHSLNYHRLGREATMLDINRMNYYNIIDSIRRNKIIKTYEFKPSEGKYFYDGHRPDRHSNRKDYFCSPRRNLRICPVCGNELTKGVLSRVYELSDQEPNKKVNFQYIVPLLSLISIVLGGNEYSKANLSIYDKLISNNGGEFSIWEGKSNFEGIPEHLINAIYKIRNDKFWFIPGHDAVYGKLQLEI